MGVVVPSMSTTTAFSPSRRDGSIASSNVLFCWPSIAPLLNDVRQRFQTQRTDTLSTGARWSTARGRSKSASLESVALPSYVNTLSVGQKSFHCDSFINSDMNTYFLACLGWKFIYVSFKVKIQEQRSIINCVCGLNFFIYAEIRWSRR